MKNKGHLTYARLSWKLKSLGYTEVRTTLDGKPTRVYEHPKYDSAMFFLPDGDDTEVVPTPLVGKVLIILKTHGLIEEQNPLLT